MGIAPAAELDQLDLASLLPDMGLSPGTFCVRHLTVDSREVVPGCVFVAIPGARTDGHRYVTDAIAKGAAVVFYQTGRALSLDASAYPHIVFMPVPDTRAFVRRLAAPFYDLPSTRMGVVTITGTNGKTTCSFLLEAIQRNLGSNTGLISTIGIRYRGASIKLGNAVPEPCRLQAVLSAMAQAGVRKVILEVSSQALVDERLNGVHIDAAILTNVTRDHLDVHGSLENYLDAKLLLFDLLQRSGKDRKTASIWRDCWQFEKIARRLAELGISACVHHVGGALPAPFGPSGSSLRADNVSCGPEGTSFDLFWRDARLSCRTSLLGRFNVLNILAAIGSDPDFLDSVFSGDARRQAALARALTEVRVPGRLEPIPNDIGATILVDYAHTEDGLEKVLETLRAFPHNHLYLVFGAMGDRDRGKRPHMGAVAARLADFSFVTSTSPNTEDAGSIIAAITQGYGQHRNYAVVEDREQAIMEAINVLTKGDILVIAGKGHETTMTIGTDELPFSDHAVVRKRLAGRG